MGGAVFCKVGQTFATRPDIIGLEISRNLGQLQDAMAPESGGRKVAMATLSDALGDVSRYLVNISEAPVAAASLAEVYRATTLDSCCTPAHMTEVFRAATSATVHATAACH